jgi:hypothetical protein
MAFAQSVRNRLALASGPLGTNRLLWGGAAGLVLLIGGGVGWLGLNRFHAPDTSLQKEQRTQNGTGLSGVDDDPYRQAQIQKQEAEQANKPPFPGTVSMPSIESAYLDQQRAKRDAVTESRQHAMRTQPNKTTQPTTPPVVVNTGMMLGYLVAENAAMAAMTNQADTSENFKTADIEKWQADALKAAQASGKDGTAGDRSGASSQTPKHCLGLGGMKVMGIPKLAATMETDSPQTPAEVEMTTGPLTGYRLAGEVQKHGDTLTVGLNTLYYNSGDVPVDAILVSPLTQETTVASSVDRHLPARIGGPALAGAFQGLGQAAQTSGSTFAAGPYGAAQSFSRFDPWQIGGMMAGGAATGAQSVLRDVLPKGSTVTLSTSDPVEVFFKKDVCVPN